MAEGYGSGADVEDFMTQEEIEKICGIYLRAKKRKKEAEEEGMGDKCPCRCANNTCDSSPAKVMGEVKKILQEMCKLCRTYNCCIELQDEELPDFLDPDIEEPL